MQRSLACEGGGLPEIRLTAAFIISLRPTVRVRAWIKGRSGARNLRSIGDSAERRIQPAPLVRSGLFHAPSHGSSCTPKRRSMHITSCCYARAHHEHRQLHRCQGSPRPPPHTRQGKRETDGVLVTRPAWADREGKGLYKTALWESLRKQTLLRDGYTCQISGVLLRGGRSDRTATVLRPAVVDHLMPHMGDASLFFDPDNLWVVSSDVHDTVCQAIERRRGLSLEAVRAAKVAYRHIGLDGYPCKPSGRWVDARWPA